LSFKLYNEKKKNHDIWQDGAIFKFLENPQNFRSSPRTEKYFENILFISFIYRKYRKVDIPTAIFLNSFLDWDSGRQTPFLSVQIVPKVTILVLSRIYIYMYYINP
jgi:hypothetical protein